MNSLANQNSDGTDMQAMKIKFDGQTHMIEANTFINSLIHFTTVVQEVNKELDPDKKVEVKIKANKEGSFIVDIVIQAQSALETVKGLFSNDNVQYAAGLVTVLGSVYGVAKFLGGKKPNDVITADENTLKIENNNGTVNNFDLRGANIYLGNRTIRDAISKEFSTLENDESVTGFELLDNNDEPLVVIPRTSFYEIADDDTNTIDKNERVLPMSGVMLNIVALDLELKKKWDFYYEGNKISARVKDDTFRELINKGERFGKGDSLKVDMDIKQEFDDSVNAFVNKGYTVTKIHGHFQKPPQGTLGL